MNPTSSTPPGILGKITAVIAKTLALFGLPWTQKFVAHILTVGLTAAAVALLPLELSTQVNAAIVVVAGLVAHWLAPSEG